MLRRNRPYNLAAVLTAVAGLLLVPAARDAAAQQEPGTAVTAPTDGWATESRPAAPPELLPENDSEAVKRAREALSESHAGTGVALSARLTDDGRTLTRDLTWRVYSDPKDADDKPKLIATRNHASPQFKLEPGTYLIHVSFGRSHITKRVVVNAGTMKQETFVLNAGGLRLAAYAGEKKVPDNTVNFDIYEAETDQSGQRRLIVAKGRPGVIIRLNAGIYFLRSTYGGANAHVESEVSVEAGKLTEIALAHAAAKVTLGLVTRPGGEALPATQWTISTPEGDVVDRSVGALPSHILAPGTYKVTASNGGRVFKQEFKVEDNQTARVEILAK